MGRTALVLFSRAGDGDGFIVSRCTGPTSRDPNSVCVLKYMNARNLARASVHAALRTYDKNATPEVQVKTSFNNGSFQMTALLLALTLTTFI